MSNQIPVKPINEIEVKSEVSENDKILILDSESEEARLAPKTDLKGTDAWEYMTQSQYDALPDSKLTDWVSRMVYTTAQQTFRTLLRATNNVLNYNENDELYADLQFQNWLTPTSAFPAWVSIGNVNSNDWWRESWLLVNAKTNSWDYLRRLYGSDGKLYYDWWTGVFKEIFTSDDISAIVEALRSELSTVAFTWNSSDLNNDAGFDSVPIMTQAEYDEQSWAASDDKRYFIYETY